MCNRLRRNIHARYPRGVTAHQRAAVAFAAGDIENGLSRHQRQYIVVAMPVLVPHLTLCLRGARDEAFAGEWKR